MFFDVAKSNSTPAGSVECILLDKGYETVDNPLVSKSILLYYTLLLEGASVSKIPF